MLTLFSFGSFSFHRILVRKNELCDESKKILAITLPTSKQIRDLKHNFKLLKKGNKKNNPNSRVSFIKASGNCSVVDRDRSTGCGSRETLTPHFKWAKILLGWSNYLMWPGPRPIQNF